MILCVFHSHPQSESDTPKIIETGSTFWCFYSHENVFPFIDFEIQRQRQPPNDIYIFIQFYMCIIYFFSGKTIPVANTQTNKSLLHLIRLLLRFMLFCVWFYYTYKEDWANWNRATYTWCTFYNHTIQPVLDYVQSLPFRLFFSRLCIFYQRSSSSRYC